MISLPSSNVNVDPPSRTRRRPRPDPDGLPDLWWQRVAAARAGCRCALGVMVGLTVVAVVAILWAIRGGGSESVSMFVLFIGALFAALLLVAWFALIGSYVDTYAARPRIVPYFRGSVPGPDTFYEGEALAQNCKPLDRLAVREGVAPLSDFGFADDFRGDEARWHPAAAGLTTFQTLFDRLLEEPALLPDAEPVLVELLRVRDKLVEADRLQVDFCLHLRADTAYSGQEFDSRKGRYWG